MASGDPIERKVSAGRQENMPAPVQPQVKTDTVTSPAGFGEEYARAGLQPTILGQVGAVMAQSAGNALAEKRGYFKLDLLNVHVYTLIQDEQHLIRLMNREPNWAILKDYNKMKELIHIGNHYRSIKSMPEPIDSIPRLAMFLALIRPAKKHLIGLPWSEVSKTIWDKGADGYSFKKSHAIAYAQLVVVHMNLLWQTFN